MILNCPGCEFSRSCGRITVNLLLIQTGRDYVAILGGGQAHTGAIAIARSGRLLNLFELEGHREKELAAQFAIDLSLALNSVVSVNAGIHYERISKTEIETVMGLACQLLAEAINFVKENRNALD